ncbi:MAG TPA: thioredoxin domain-containing protein [archaeon]|nr:thioredoxin domain-containing protein [archaeon]
MDNSKKEHAVEKVPKPLNRLQYEKSPYLIQHAANPVDWYPWSEEAFQRANLENKPVFLSIGYSTCHWCHVMAHESFEDSTVAALMNEVFVSIKVDREERPDIDKVYMTVCQMLTGSGGWPLTIIMTPEKEPFFAGTYIPRTGRFGRAGMLELIPRIREVWEKRREDVFKAAGQITSALRRAAEETPGKELTATDIDRAFGELGIRFDRQNGGFGSAPKFPTPHNLLFCLRYWKRSGSEEALRIVEKTLQKMRLGGICDQVGFGFHRYSTDSQWLVPHFEKMLYDQALLALAALETCQATGDEQYARTAREIFTYVLRDMQSPQGAFYSAEDADSEGEEGRFYLWTEGEIRSVLGPEDTDLALRVFNVKPGGNFATEATGNFSGANILHLEQDLSAWAANLGMPEPVLRERLEAIRTRLFRHRESRVHPGKDTKVLTDWNALMIASLARGAQVLGESRYGAAAKGAADFILKKMIDSQGRLLHRFKDGEAAIAATADDYAFTVWALLELYEAGFDVRYLESALELNEDFLEHFRDKEQGGFYFTADDAEKLPVRQKELYDGATPSGNSVAVWNLLRLGRITAKPEFEDLAASISRAFSHQLQNAPAAFTHFYCALDFALGSGLEVVIAEGGDKKDTERMLAALRGHFFPNKVVLLRPRGEKPAISEIAPFVLNCESLDNKATAYVCRNHNCRLPTTDPQKMLELLKENTGMKISGSGRRTVKSTRRPK